MIYKLLAQTKLVSITSEEMNRVPVYIKNEINVPRIYLFCQLTKASHCVLMIFWERFME